ncbi:inositol monophosphatase 1 (Inositol-1(or 4)-monophosphatase 1) [Coccidioides immitis H538.4]|uniref:Inositol-1-monophosphatase n=1 Tax=Coccidioides immitis H538.4 TaxID=396776 RepID=A0A0J8S126_COCIT|nr:inositol monophosphatase 1 (Inositol-1(or 4)-monophosphatase 1) [Coccidioides immitis H538.4]
MTTSTSISPNLQEIHDCFIELAKQAGEMITGAKPLVNTVGSKKNSSDLVTETDRAVEQMLGMRLTNAPTFIVDPIDGTVNFVHNFPNACISLGFAIEKKPVVGVVFNPFTKTFALVGVEWGSDRHGTNWETKIRTFETLGKAREEGGAMVHSMRSMGSAALNLCAVASGYMDLYWEGGCWAWDVCAGWVILTEAGGIMVDGNPGGWNAAVDGRRYLAIRASKNGEGQKEIVEEFWGQIKGKFDYGQ